MAEVKMRLEGLILVVLTKDWSKTKRNFHGKCTGDVEPKIIQAEPLMQVPRFDFYRFFSDEIYVIE